jgi:hypothetical protein
MVLCWKLACKTDAEFIYIDDYFRKHISKFDQSKFGFREKILYNANLWRSFFGTRFLSCYKYALKWVTLFMILKYDIFESCIFSKGNHYLLSLCTCWNTNLSSKIFGFIRRNNKDPRFPVNDNIASYPFIFVQ